jgi:Ca2+-binding RTX toxin-like protein
VVADTDSANLTAKLTLSNVAAGSLNTGTAGAVTSTYNAATGVWSAAGAKADVNTLLAALTFTPAPNFNANFTIATSVSDGVAAAVTGSKAFTGTAVNDAPTGVVTIAGVAAQGQTLTASNTLADVDGLGAIAYQWKAAGVAISGATASTLVLAAAQVGKVITVSAGYTDAKGTAESVASVATAAVTTPAIVGTAGADTLNGTAGADQLVGLAGDDTYAVNNVGDVVLENLNEGTDLVNATVSYTLASNVENLTLGGTTAINATGNALDNVLTGNSAANVLTGGAGNDTYIASTGDTTIEAVNAGTDTVQTAIAWTLAANVENLTLTGTAAVNGTGNASDNVLFGNSAANILTGDAGADTLRGLGGADSLFGGTGNDIYWLARGYGIDSITENDATVGNTDLARFETGIATDQLWFQHVGSNLEVSIIGTADKFVMNNWYLGNQYHVEQFKTSDGKTLLDSQVSNLVDAMAALAIPAFGQTVLPVGYATTLAPVFAANWV